MKKEVFDELIVVKRSGQRVSFNSYKIAVAIKNAFDSLEGNYDESDINRLYEDVLSFIEKEYEERKTINVEDIQDIIASKLKEGNYPDVYTAFTEYRKKRAESRQAFTLKQQHKFAKAMEKIADDNLLRSENNFTPVDILHSYGKTVANEFSKSYIIDNKYIRSHEEGSIYIHDMETFPLGMFAHTNLLVEDFFEKNDSVNSFANYLINSKNEINGEVNVSAIDEILSSYILYRFKLMLKENLGNYLRITGFSEYLNLSKIYELIDKETEIPFSYAKYEPFILSDVVERLWDNAYDDAIAKLEYFVYQKINRLITRLEASNKPFSISFGKNNTFIGKIIKQAIIQNINDFNYLTNVSFIYNITAIDDPFINAISELLRAGKNILLAFINTSYNKDENTIEYFANGIRLFDNYNDKRASKGRMVVATTSINMARLGLNYEAKTKKELFEKLDELLELVKNELLLTFELIGNKSKDNYRILFTGNILSDEKLENAGGKIRKVIKNGALNIGLVGLKECVKALCKEDKEKSIKLLKEIVKYVSKKCEEFSKETKLNFYVCEPYMSRCGKAFMALDKSIYGIRNDITDKCCYELVGSIAEDNYALAGEIQKLFVGGAMFQISISANLTHKKIMDIIKELYANDVGIVKFVREDICK